MVWSPLSVGAISHSGCAVPQEALRLDVLEEFSERTDGAEREANS
jgi:hypothetical protein